ncbi:MAG TPA: hypothetical protein VD862_00560 [Candidatus Paceibacterota bacterium]|nr:hypothetical protein [Candidatus Paceibacterota bacterium]
MKFVTGLLAASFLLAAGAASAQVLTPAETLGKGNDTFFLSENHLFVDGDRLNIAYAGYMRGVTERADVYGYAGVTHIFGEDQVWLGIGGNVRLFRYKGFTVSSFNVLSTGLHRRSESSTVLWNTAAVVSRNLSQSVSVWSGVNALLPLGNREQGLFTPPDYEWNVPVGASWLINDRFGVYGEVDFGHVTAVGVGLSIAN